MKLVRMQLVGFMTHTNTQLDLPPAGVVLFTGKNGAGKSTVAEGIAFGRWGKTLRGKSPWKAGAGNVVHVYDDGTTITRSLKGGKADLKFSVGPDAPVKYENLTKAQEALEKLVGQWALWRKSSVFSSADAASFSTSTDGDRKRLIEELLGIDRFDTALKAARVDLGLATTRMNTATNNLRIYQERLVAAEKRVADADASLKLSGGDVDIGTLTAEIDRLQKVIASTQEDIAKGSALVRQAQQNRDQLAGAKSRAWERAARFGVATCPTCEQSITPEMKAKVGAETSAEMAKLTEGVADAQEALDVASSEVEELQGEVQALHAKLRPLQQAADAYRGSARAREHATETRKAALLEREDAEEAIDGAKASLAAAKADAALYGAVERVLGLRGVRAAMLGEALTALQEAANEWLARISGPGLRLVLNAYSENGAGAVADKIAFDVLGAGNGHGYQASSGGERRRLDIAIMLALGDMAAAAAGRTQEIVIFDEVFDTLDKDGVEAVTDVVRELAQDRLCIVISHSEDVVGALPVVAHYDVADGQLNRLR